MKTLGFLNFFIILFCFVFSLLSVLLGVDETYLSLVLQSGIVAFFFRKDILFICFVLLQVGDGGAL